MHLDGETLTVDQLAEAAYQNTSVEVFPEQAARVKASRDLLTGFVESGRIIYGVTTAVGGFVNWLIPEELAEKLQNNILRGVATNVGADLDDVYVRAAMLCRINSLGRGVSAISPENFEKYIAVYNAGIVPCVPEQGSLGASGDLGPLAHIALVVTGAWRAHYEGEVLSGEEALKRAGLEPARLSYKEGLAMINRHLDDGRCWGASHLPREKVAKTVGTGSGINARSVTRQDHALPSRSAPQQTASRPGQSRRYDLVNARRQQDGRAG